MKKLVVFLPACLFLLAQEKVDEVTDARMRSEEMEHSQLLHTLHMLTDRYGPRVTGTPNHEAAAKWAIAEMTRWGLKNAHLEAWEFGHPGWLNESADGHIVSPVKQNLKFEVIAWTPSTNGPLTASVLEVQPPQGPFPPADPNAAGRGPGRGATQRLGPLKTEFDHWIEANKDVVRGRIVFIGKAAEVPVNFDPPAKRQSDDAVRRAYDPANPNGGRGGRGPAAPEDPSRYSLNEVNERIDAMLVANGALMRVNDAARGEGVIVAQQHRGYDPATAVPTVVLRNDDYGRVERLIADGEDVRLQFNIVNHVYPEGKTSYNAIGEIPGTDKADEIVMLGGHLDSWHAATGATDNAIGCSIMMEAVRLIQNSGVKPRRTIRVALWSGEEEGLLGSLAYVKQHFGTAENPKPEWFKLDAYLNVDTGTGRIRGAGVFGPPEAAAVLRPVLSQYAEWGVGGASSSSSRAVGGTDSTSFNNAGLPGIGMSQDPIEYNTLTHHTNLDTYERIVPDDVKKDAVIIAAQVLHLANRDEMLPRFTKDKMPAPVPVRPF
ncbi:MAG TPA: M20/M25/M40 family metallo-hydrolase [Bryobacteraceae bacterium]|nr:M20/M25/M40 family metallo-hydrolase [Bryobacteraceae bacterium]